MRTLHRLSWLPLSALGLACLGDIDEPQPPIETVAYASVHVGSFHACGRTAAGQLYCWGGNAEGQGGNGGFEDQLFPTPASQGDTRFIAVALGGLHSCAIATDRSVHCWGSNARGQHGVGTLTAPAAQPTPTNIPLEFQAVTTGDLHTCGVTLDQEAWCWGMAESGRLGNEMSGVGAIRATADSVRGGLSFFQLSAGGGHTCGVTTANEVYCWGAGLVGQLGDDGTSNRDVPVGVVGDLLFAQVSAGGDHTCAITLEGTAYCWGEGSSGQLGTGSVSSEPVPTQVASTLAFGQITTGGAHTCGLADRAIYCWGGNDAGQLGDGSTENRTAPVPVAGGIEFESVEAGKGRFTTVTCGRGTDGFLYCWGFGPGGQTGTGSLDNALTPQRVFGQEQAPGVFHRR